MLYTCSIASRGMRRAMMSIGARTSVRRSIGITPLHTKSAFDDENDGNTKPGQSAKSKSSPSSSVWKCFVLPGVALTPVFFSATIAFTVLDLPTFG